jgi:HSP20 family protein
MNLKQSSIVNQKANLLTIGANVPTQASDEGKPENTSKLVRKEFESHSFERSFTLPETVETEGINAQYINGILHVSVPKKEVAKPELRKIEIA